MCPSEVKEQLSLKTKRFELYAPSKKELKKAKEELEYAVKKFKFYLGEYPPKIVTILFNNSEEMKGYDFNRFTKRKLQVLNFFIPNALRAADMEISRKIPAWKKKPDKKNRHPLSHEAGHMFLRAYCNNNFAKLSRRKQRQSRSISKLLLPAWFNEAVATLCEFPSLQKERYAVMKKYMKEIIPLRKFFTLVHPAAKIMKKKRKPKIIHSNKTSTFFVLDKAFNTLISVFYAQALTFTHFLAEKEGPKFIGKMAKEFLKGKNINEILRQAESVSSNFSKLEATWLKWLGSRLTNVE